MQSNRIKMAAAGVVTVGSLVAGVGVAQAAVPSLSNSPGANLPTSGPALTAEVLSDGSVLVQGTGFKPNDTLPVDLDDGTLRTIAEYPTTGANGNFVTEFPEWFIASCFPSGVTVYSYVGNVRTNSIAVPGAGCAVPPTGGGGGTGGSGSTLWPHVHYQ